MFCTRCGRQVSADARFCSWCGSPTQLVPPQTRSIPGNSPKRTFKWIVGITCGFLVCLFLMVIIGVAISTSSMEQNEGVEFKESAVVLPASDDGSTTRESAVEQLHPPAGTIPNATALTTTRIQPPPPSSEANPSAVPFLDETDTQTGGPTHPSLTPTPPASTPPLRTPTSPAAAPIPSSRPSKRAGETLLARGRDGNLVYRRPTDGALFEEISYRFSSGSDENVSKEKRDPRHQLTKDFGLRDGYFCFDAKVGSAGKVEFWLGRTLPDSGWAGRLIAALGSGRGFGSSTCISVYDTRDGQKVSRADSGSISPGGVEAGNHNIKVFAIPHDAEWEITICTRGTPFHPPDKTTLQIEDLLHCGPQ